MSKIMGFTQQNYKITATLGVKVIQNQVTRNEGTVTLFLGTPHGIVAWLHENQPFVSVTITEMATKKDCTTEFVRDLQFIKSRYQGGMDYVNLYGEFGS